MNTHESTSRSLPLKKQLNRLKSFLLQRTSSLKVTPGSRFRSTTRSNDVRLETVITSFLRLVNTSLMKKKKRYICCKIIALKQ